MPIVEVTFGGATNAAAGKPKNMRFGEAVCSDWVHCLCCLALRAGQG